LRAWLDACTGKHIRYATAIARELRARGHEVLLTTREHPDTLALARLLGEEFRPVGRYVPHSRVGKLLASVEREAELARTLAEGGWWPDVAICHQSVELCRVAFGLGVPIICTTDSPHARAVGRLTLPLAEVVVASEALPSGLLRELGAKRVEQFRGVDEVAWVRRPELLTPADAFPWLKELERPLIVVREEEHGAAYARGRGLMARIAARLAELGTVVFLARYGRPEGLPEEVLVPEGFVDAATLAGEADLVVGVGGTICREAALQGTPVLVVRYLGRLHVNAYLAEKGFPLREVGPEAGEVLAKARELLGARRDVGHLLASLEDPVELIVRLAEELAGQGVPQHS